MKPTFAFGLFFLAAVSTRAASSPSAVRTDLVVRDSHGKLVPNLEPGDFLVREDGAASPIRAVHFEDGARSAKPVWLTLLFDDLTGEMSRFSREAAYAVLAAKTPNSQVAVLHAAGRIEALHDYTADAKALRAAVDLATGRKSALHAAPPPAALPFNTAGILRTAARLSRQTRAHPLIATLLAIASEQSRAPGRKAIVLFSQGAGIGGASEDALRAIISTANRAGVAIYSVDAAAIATSSRIAQARESMMFQLQSFGLRNADIQGSGRAGQLGHIANYQHAQDGTASDPDRPVDRGPLPPLVRLASGTGGFVVSRHDSFRGPLRRIPEETASYYTLDYQPADARLDGRFRTVRIQVPARKLRVQDREGYFAAPVIPGVAAAPFEIPLMELLAKGPRQDFRATTSAGHFRTPAGDQPLTTVSLEVQGTQVEFSEESEGVLYRAHISALALIRGPDGAVLEKFSGDTPVQCPSSMLEETRERYFVFQEQFNLPPGAYTLETIVQDRISGRSVSFRGPLSVPPASAAFDLGTVFLVRHTAIAGDDPGDSPFVTGGKRIIPALDGRLTGGKDAKAPLFLRLYPDPAALPAHLDLRILRDHQLAQSTRVELPPAGPGSLARILSVDIGTLAPGPYVLEVAASSGAVRTTRQLPLVILPGVTLAGAAGTPAVESGAGPAATPPTAAQRKLLDAARQTALQYATKLPDFICTQVTRRLLDAAAHGHWMTLEEAAQLVTFYDGQEHYHNLTASTAQTRDALPAMTSSGEFGSVLKQIFRPESEARFAWVRPQTLRGRAVQVYAYDVDAKHGQYRVGYNSNEFKAPVLTGFHGLVFIDEQTSAVIRLTHETATLPDRFPIRQFALSVDYDDISVGGKPYILPVEATLNLRLRKKTLIRNEVSFRSYQRFTSQSRVLSFDPQQIQPMAGQPKP